MSAAAVEPRVRRARTWTAVVGQGRRGSVVSYGLVAVLASAFFAVGSGAGWAMLAAPLGRADLLPAYVNARLWSEGSPFGSTSFGFPFGMDLRYYPTLDVFQNLTAGLITHVSGNPFLGMNLVYALSFPVTAVSALWVLRLTGSRGVASVLLALAFTVIPYHWYRLDHVYLGTTYSVVLAVGLAILIGSGELERRFEAERRWRSLTPLVLLLVLIAWSGIYYACFAILLALAAAVYRLAHGAGLRGIIMAVAPAALLFELLGAGLAPALLHRVMSPPFEPVAERAPIESVQYSGALAFTLLPAPTSQVPGMGPVDTAVQRAFDLATGRSASGVLWLANFGSLPTTAALAFVGIGAVMLSRQRWVAASRAPDGEPAGARAGDVAGATASFGLVGLLTGTALLFFVPWGLNYLFAAFVTPEVRAWNRLVPAILLLVLVAALMMWRRLAVPLASWLVAVVSVVVLAVIVLDSVLPYRTYFATTSAEMAPFADAGYAYAAELNSAVPGDCGVLQLPYVDFPEVPPVVDMGNYEHFWVALTNPDKSWSFGAIKGTSASAWAKDLGNTVTPSAVTQLGADGFCAIHVDRRGFAPAEGARVVDRLRSLLGEPVAVGLDGSWLAFALPGSRG